MGKTDAGIKKSMSSTFIGNVYDREIVCPPYLNKNKYFTSTLCPYFVISQLITVWDFIIYVCIFANFHVSLSFSESVLNDTQTNAWHFFATKSKFLIFTSIIRYN